MALILTEEKMDKATRVIFKCGRKACKHVWAIEYTHKRYDSLYRVENGNQVWRQEDYHCPKCNDECYVKATNVVGVYNEKHACNARCMSSTSGVCSCSCGGANHGAGHLTVQEHIIEVEGPITEEMAQEAAETTREEVKVVEQEEKKAMTKTPTIETPTTAIELYNLSNEFNNMRQSTKKRAIATMLENMACEHGYITIEGKMYHFNGDKLTRNYEESKCYWCNLTSTCCTCGEEKPVNANGECNDCASLEAIEEIIVAKPINEEIATVAESLNLPVEEVAKVFAIAQEYKQLKQSDRETFKAESRLETVQVQEKERREMEQDQAIMTQLLSNDGYNGYRIAESEYSRQYENGAYVPQYRSGDGHWRSYFHHTANRFSVGRGTKSYKSTSITYKTAKGAMGYLVKQGLELEPPSAGTI